jgi:ribonuclease Z
MKRILFTVLAFCASAALPAQTTQPVIRVTLLGTGVPLIDPVAFVASGRVLSGTLIEAGSERMLFDVGQGVVTRLLQSGGDPNNPNIAVDKLFISHLHSDHIADLASLYSYGWLYRYDVPLKVWGPGPGPNQAVSTGSIMQLLRVVYDTDFYVRCCAFSILTFPLSGVQPIASDLGEGVVYSNNGVTVTAFLVDHHPVSPAYGFRVDYQGHSVAYSGDTTFTPNLPKFAKGVDVLINEIWGFAPDPELYNYHCPPETCAAPMFIAAAPKLAVFTHIAIPPGTTTDDLVARTRKAGYTGPLQVGADMMVIDVLSDKVTVTPHSANSERTGSTEGGVPAEMRGRRPLAVYP